MKRYILIIALLLGVMLMSQNELYAAYCNNPSTVTFTRSGTTGYLSWNNVGSSYYYWCIKTVTPFGNSEWPGAGSLQNGYTSGSTSLTIYGLPSTGTLYAYVSGVNSSWEWCAPPSAQGGEPAPPVPSCTNAGTPSSASASAASATSANLSWGTSSGSATITYYWSCGPASGNTTGTSATAYGLSPNTSYTMSVYAQSNSTGCTTASGSRTSSSFTTPKNSQTITFGAIPAKIYGNSDFSPGACILVW